MEIAANIFAILLVLFGGAFLVKTYFTKQAYLKQNKQHPSKDFYLNAASAEIVTFWHPKKPHIGVGQQDFKKAYTFCEWKDSQKDPINFHCKKYGEISVATYAIIVDCDHEDKRFSHGTIQVTRVLNGSELIHEHVSYV